jgi:phosphoribosylformylglycinamidine cyclo-ligase
VFGWLKRAAQLDDPEMLRTFNCGIGMVVIAARDRTDAVIKAFKEAGDQPVILGAVEAGRGIKSPAKGKGEAEAVRYSGRLAI